MYEYRAEVTSVYDGDTITVTIDLGFDHIMRNMKLRLYGIDTPEIRGGNAKTRKAARDARDYLRALILGKEIVVRTIKDKKGKYGRYLAIIHQEDGACVNLLMAEAGHAEQYMGWDELEHYHF
jgi:micrococcal nuclease